MKKFILPALLLIGSVAVAQNKNTTPAKPANSAVAPAPVHVEEIKWVSISDLAALQAKEPRKVLIDVYTSWCGPCKMMYNQTFHDPAVVKYVNENYYAVKFNAEGNEVVNFKGYQWTNPGYDPAKANSRNSTHDLTLAIAPVQTRIAYPTIVYLDEQLNILAPLQGFFPAAQELPVLTYFKENKHKEIDLQKYLDQAAGKQ